MLIPFLPSENVPWSNRSNCQEVSRFSPGKFHPIRFYLHGLLPVTLIPRPEQTIHQEYLPLFFAGDPESIQFIRKFLLRLVILNTALH